MRRDQSHTWFLLVKAVNGKSAIIGLDDVFLSLTAHGAPDLQVIIKSALKTENPNFYTRGQVLRNIISGKYLLDKAINEGHIYVRGDINELLEMYNLVLNALLDGNVNGDFLTLWLDFVNNWKPEDAKNNCWRLEDQLPVFDVDTFI
ncbi:MAG TPA: hypothetical protein VK941_06740 [Gillisia sp.]|nr:hypothetical protein [Gillisia sp.]